MGSSEENGFQMGENVHGEGDFWAAMESDWGCDYELKRYREEHTPWKEQMKASHERGHEGQQSVQFE